MSVKASVFEAPASPAWVYLMTYRLREYTGLLAEFLETERERSAEAAASHRGNLTPLLKLALAWKRQPLIRETGEASKVIDALAEAGRLLEQAPLNPYAARAALLGADHELDMAMNALVRRHGEIPSAIARHVPADIGGTEDAQFNYFRGYDGLIEAKNAYQNATSTDPAELLRAAQSAVGLYMAWACEVAGGNDEIAVLNRSNLVNLIEKARDGVSLRAGNSSQKKAGGASGHPLVSAMTELQTRCGALFGTGRSINEPLYRNAAADSTKRECAPIFREHHLARPDDNVTVKYVRGAAAEAGVAV